MHFNRLRLSGFKSFVDPTELYIEGGLTGIVGPNGCGKSNLLDAIRWVMAESSPKSLRGSGMDDVIFAGTSSRPARNLAEVTLALDNSERSAPAAFNDADEIEVCRRIERESGSAYRINGQEVRAKDVQLLFADAATGAHSPALVSQGHIGSLINAKPAARRAILEEAAGITGLHTRRKEAESRLRAAEANLVRLQDVMIQMEAQMASLKRQARQATRYRNISGDIRRAEAAQLYLKWRESDAAISALDEELSKAVAGVTNLTREATRLTAEQTDLSAKIPALRQTESEAGAALHRLTVERDQLAAEKDRIEQAKSRVAALLIQLAADQAREEQGRTDAAEALERLGKEQAEIEKLLSSEAETAEVAEAALAAAQTEASGAESVLDSLMREEANAHALRERLESEKESAERRLARLKEEYGELSERLENLKAEQSESGLLQKAEKTLTEADAELNKANDAVEAAEKIHRAAQAFRDGQSGILADAKSAVVGLEAERDGLQALMAGVRGDGTQPVANALTVEPGYEKALGAALGEDLEAPVADSGMVRWNVLPPLETPPTLPEGTLALSDFVKAPGALARRLSQIAVAEADRASGLALQLLPGQRLVTKEGALWRWDGFSATSEAPSPEAARLAQRNRISQLEKRIGKAREESETAQAGRDKAEAEVNAAREQEQAARHSRAETEAAASQALRALSGLEKESAKRSSQLSALEEARNRILQNQEECSQELNQALTKQKDVPDISNLSAEITKCRTEVEALREKLAGARAAYDGLKREREAKKRRLDHLKTERDAWALRHRGCEDQLKRLNERKGKAEKEQLSLQSAPDEIEEKRKRLIDALEQAEAGRQQAADILAEAENILAEKDRELRATQTRLSEARENRIRIEAAMDHHAMRRDEVSHAIDEKFQCLPARLLEETGKTDAGDLPDLEAVETRLSRLLRERERLGAVNLRADEELTEISEQAEHLTTEREDLEAAIARLRQAISSLNREGRERLLKAFEDVNAHFSELFITLFGGGQAHLSLIESDDPLEAGLEIMASPPGKRLQVLSLLSGGEQALTATSLIFAVFMTNPAPICVLDEVDAPLDDANVDRFCNLVEDINRRTQTRFLIVTHNAVTMSRMDRLFGVTMAERGVSQLVSVDLQKAGELRAVG